MTRGKALSGAGFIWGIGLITVDWHSSDMGIDSVMGRAQHGRGVHL